MTDTERNLDLDATPARAAAEISMSIRRRRFDLSPARTVSWVAGLALLFSLACGAAPMPPEPSHAAELAGLPLAADLLVASHPRRRQACWGGARRAVR